MSTKRKNRREYDEEDETNLYKTSKGKHKKHAHNVKGKGMRVINSYVEEDIDEPFFDEELDDEIFGKDTKTRFYISTTR